jgi:hypothetical protein
VLVGEGELELMDGCKCFIVLLSGKEADQHHLLTCDALRSYHDIARMMLEDFIKDSGTGPIFDNAAKEYNKALATIHQLKLTLTNKHGSDTATSEKIKRLINYPTSPHTHSTLNNQAHGFNPKLYSELRSTWNKKQAAERYINGFKTKATALTSELNLLLDEDFISLYLLTDYVLTNQGIPDIKIGTKRLSKAQCKTRTDQMLQDKTVEHLVRPPISSHGFLYTYYHLLLGAAYLTLVWRDPNLPRTATKATTTTSPITRQTNPFPTSAAPTTDATTTTDLPSSQTTKPRPKVELTKQYSMSVATAPIYDAVIYPNLCPDVEPEPESVPRLQVTPSPLPAAKVHHVVEPGNVPENTQPTPLRGNQNPPPRNLKQLRQQQQREQQQQQNEQKKKGKKKQ